MNVGDIVTGKVIKIAKTHFLVELDGGYQGMTHISSASDYYVTNLTHMFSIGSEYDFKVLEVENRAKRVKLDWKSIHPRFQKNPFKYEIRETENGFKNLKENTEKEVEND